MPRSLIRVLFLILAVGAFTSLSSPVALAQKRLPNSQAEVTLSYAPLVKQAAPAVVNIYTKKTVVERPQSPFANDPFFRQFFGGLGRARKREEQSLGSGVIVDRDGTVVTNNHVINGADEIRVILADRREFDAELVGADERTDLAMLRLMDPPADLATLTFANSDEVEVGDLVLAIGNPFGVGQTVTTGIVSALARSQVNRDLDFQNFIQTDAAINPGNSGGALIDMHGRLIGINTAIFTRSGGSNGIGFAVPANMVRATLSGFRGGRVVRPWVGASLQAVTNDLAASLGLERPTGVLVTAVREGGPADGAQLKKGDVVLSVNGIEVTDPDSFAFRIATLSLGTRAKLEVFRRNRVFEASLPLEAPPETPPRNITIIQGRNPIAGAEVANLNPALADELGRPMEEQGVIVLRIRRNSIAARMRLQPGDLIVSLANNEITTVAELTRILTRRDGNRSWRIAVKRGSRIIRAELDL